MATNVQQQTGATNLEFDLISVLYHCLEGNQAITQYIRDAQNQNDQETLQCFQQIQQQNMQNVNQLRNILTKRVQSNAWQTGAQQVGQQPSQIS